MSDPGERSVVSGNGAAVNGRAVSGRAVLLRAAPAGPVAVGSGVDQEHPAVDAPTGRGVEIRNAVECLLLARGGPVRVSELRTALEVDEAELLATLAALQVEYEGRGLQIQEIAEGYQLCTRPDYADYVQRLLRLEEIEPLTRSTLEVLAIVAYRQPVTRASVDAIRGVQSVHHLIKLQDRRLVREVGRRPGPGRPILYGTTEGFLRYFGLKDLSALPQIEDHELTTALVPPGA